MGCVLFSARMHKVYSLYLHVQNWTYDAILTIGTELQISKNYDCFTNRKK